MSTPLSEQHCVVCKPGTPTLPAAEIDQLRLQVPGWEVVVRAGHLTLTRTLRFKGFMPGVEFVDEIADIAETEGHHPDLHLSYGSLRVELWTHAAGGLTRNDFVLAARIDQLGPT